MELSIEIGGDGPPLLFTTPGWGASIHGYRHLQPLEDRFTVIWTETRGTGESSAPDDNNYLLSSFTADTEALREALGIERWWVAGHSYGGALAQDYMAQHPDRCIGAILLCTRPVPAGPDSFQDILDRGMSRAGDPGCDAALEAFAAQPATDAEATAMIRDILPLYFRTLESAQRFGEECEGMTCRIAPMVAEYPQSADRTSIDLLPSVDIPTVIIAASDDFVCSPPKNQQVHLAIPGSKFMIIEKAGHFPWFEKPEEFWSSLDSGLAAIQPEPG